MQKLLTDEAHLSEDEEAGSCLGSRKRAIVGGELTSSAAAGSTIFSIFIDTETTQLL